MRSRLVALFLMSGCFCVNPTPCDFPATPNPCANAINGMRCDDVGTSCSVDDIPCSCTASGYWYCEYEHDDFGVIVDDMTPSPPVDGGAHD